MSAEKQKHDRNVSWDEPFDCNYHATKGIDILLATDLNYARRCVLACAGLNPDAVPELVNMVEAMLREPLSEGKRKYVLYEGLRTAFAAAKKVEGE
jgi:hypothetical protein